MRKALSTQHSALSKVALILFLLSGIGAHATDPCAGTGYGTDVPTNCAITQNGTSATFTWNTVNPADSMVLVCQNNACSAGFVPSRQVYDATMVTSHSVTVPYLQPNGYTYYWNVASCEAGPNCPSQSTSWGVAPGSSPLKSFVTASTAHPAGTISLFAMPQGPSSAWQDATGYASLPVGLNLLVTDGTWSTGYSLYTTAATVDGQSCLPAVLGTSTTLGSACGTSGIKFQFVGTGSELINPATNNYGVIIGSGTFAGEYRANGVSGILAEPGSSALLYGVGPSAIGAHTLSITLQAASGTTAVGSPFTITFPFTINAYPSFTATAPSTFPAIPSLGNYWASAATHGTAEVSVFANGFADGLFLNDNMSAVETAIDPFSVANYDGNMIYKYLGDQAASVSATWTSGHAYSLGDQILASGYVETVTTAGTSGGTIPSGLAASVPGGTTVDGGATWTNGGNKLYWNEASEVVGQSYMDWANIEGYTGLTGTASGASEWNVFPFGPIMDFYRQGDTYGGNCNSGGGCAGLAAGTINVLSGINAPSVNNGYITAPQSFLFVSAYTVRSLPYGLESLLAKCEITSNASGCMSSPEITRRVNLELNTIDALVTCNPKDGVTSTYGFCLSAPVFDMSLVGTSLIYYYDLLNHFSLATDNRVPVQLMRLHDWMIANEYNLTGTDYSFPYGFWQISNNTNNPQYLWQQQLGNLLAVNLAWQWAIDGGDSGCTFPTSGLGCRTVADKLFTTTLNAVPFSGKSFNEENEWMNNFVGWRSGAFPATDNYVLPAHNAFEGSYPDVLGPYNGQSFPCGAGCSYLYPSASAVTGSTATITWMTFEQIVGGQVKLGTTPTSPTSTVTCSPVTSTFVAGTLNLWQNTCPLSGLSPLTHYYFNVGATDAASNPAASVFAPGTYLGNSLATSLSFTTASGGGPIHYPMTLTETFTLTDAPNPHSSSPKIVTIQ